jgi:hypothetical protein
MADFSRLSRWHPVTPGERLFMFLYDYVVENSRDLLEEATWVVSVSGLNELSRLAVAMELTHRCLAVAVDMADTLGEVAPVTIMHRLRFLVGIQQGQFLQQLAQETRLAALASLGPPVPSNAVRTQLYLDWGLKCCWCGRTTFNKKGTTAGTKTTVEHLWPKYLGGTSDMANLAVACDACNNFRKHGYTWAWFATQSFCEIPDANASVKKEWQLSLALHRLMKAAGGKSVAHATGPTTLKEAARALGSAIPKIAFSHGDRNRYTYFETLNLAEE